MNGTQSVTEQPAVVIGASTAGLFAAYLLARGGVPVRLYDEAEHLGPPTRTLILTGRLGQALGSAPDAAVVNRTHAVQLFSRHRSVKVRLSEPDLIVEREKLVRLLAGRAQAAGAEIRLGCRFVGLEPDDNGVVLRLETAQGGPLEPLRTWALVGADGVASRVAAAAAHDGHPTVSLLQAKVALPAGADAATTQVWFDPEGTPYFFWLIPESVDRAVVGLVAENGADARRSLDRFLSAQGLEALDYQAAPVAFYAGNLPPSRRVSGARVLLVGDAAAQVKVSTVGGVVTGLCGARAAAQAILRGTDYRRELGALRRDLELHLLVRRALNRFSAADYDELLGLLNRRAQGILATRNRDEIGRILFPSLFAQPRLALLAVRALVRPGGRDGRG